MTGAKLALAAVSAIGIGVLAGCSRLKLVNREQRDTGHDGDGERGEQ